ncbi:MAG: hypothetical protein ABEJ36_04090 [Candidatus Nanosalina sp.]
MGYIVGLPTEIDVLKKSIDSLGGSDNGYRTIRTDDLADDFDPEEYAEREDVEVLERGQRDGEPYFRFDPKSEEAKSILGGDNMSASEDNPTPIPVAYDGSHADHEFGELEVDLREEGQRFYEENEGTYSGEENVEALGAAVLYEQSLNGQAPLDMDQLGDYILDQDLRDDFINYKADLVDEDLYDQVAQDVIDNVEEIEDIKQGLEREQMFWEAYALEAANEREVAVDALDDVHERAANIDLDTSVLQASQQARNGLVPREQAMEGRRQRLRDRSQNEF